MERRGRTRRNDAAEEAGGALMRNIKFVLSAFDRCEPKRGSSWRMRGCGGFNKQSLLTPKGLMET